MTGDRPTARLRDVARAGAALLLVGALLAACGNDATTDPHASQTPGATATASADDVMFVQMMIPHHEQAVLLADMALANETASEEVRGLATTIKSTQSDEVEQMKSWLTAWGEPMEMEGHDMTMNGMASDAQLAALKAATGTEFNHQWLTLMIAHHRGALSMSKAIAKTSKVAELAAFAQTMYDTQKAEIATMTPMLRV